MKNIIRWLLGFVPVRLYQVHMRDCGSCCFPDLDGLMYCLLGMEDEGADQIRVTRRLVLRRTFDQAPEFQGW